MRWLRLRRGALGEEAAARWARRQGWKVLERNVRSKLGEIDLIARDGATLVFVEVKARQAGSLAPPEAAVTRAKQRRLARLAQAYLQRRRLHKLPCRFDVIAVELAADASVVALHHLPGAFELSSL